MAKTKLGNATFVEHGYGQVEPNHLSAQRTGQIYAQLPAAAAITLLENGQFVKYDYENNVVNFTGDGEWMLVYNEVKLYEEKLNEDDFAMKAEDYGYYLYDAAGHARNASTQSAMVPRVFKTNIGDIYTTNCVKEATLEVGNELKVGADGYLVKPVDGTTYDAMTWKVVKVYTMPDGQKGVKLQRIA